jgi:excisionase family DNA binding protein
MPARAANAASETMSKPEVCEYLGKSKRTVETMVARGRLGIAYVQGPNGKTAVFRRSDVEALKREIDTPMHRATELPARQPDSQTAVALRPSSSDPFAGLAAHLAKLSAAFPSPPPTVGKWLTLDEASEASGLPKSWLLAQARAGAAFAMNVGSGKKAAWRFRADGVRQA